MEFQLNFIADYISYFPKFYVVFLLVFFSLVIRFILQTLGQQWITSIAQTTTLILLPIITYIITSVISGNIALSLGLVGALSIVRFRHPVRSPFELTVYFGVITAGIAASVNWKWIIFFLISIIIILPILLTINILFKKIFKKPFFNISFTEGNHMSTLDVVSTKNIEELDKSEFLSMKHNESDKVSYILISDNMEQLLIVQKKLANDKNILSCKVIK